MAIPPISPFQYPTYRPPEDEQTPSVEVEYDLDLTVRDRDDTKPRGATQNDTTNCTATGTQGSTCGGTCPTCTCTGTYNCS